MSPVPAVPSSRLRRCNDAPLCEAGDYVVYWCIAYRRTRHNFALQHAAHQAERLGKPLVFFDALRCGYPRASDRLHSFILNSIADTGERLSGGPALHYPYVEPRADHGKGLLAALAQRACLVVTDDFPAFMLPKMVAAAARQLPVRLEAVDSNGLLPMRATERVFRRAHDFRRFLHDELLPHLEAPPVEDPLVRADLPRLDALPEAITGRWPMASATLFNERAEALAALPIDHSVAVVPGKPGGEAAAQRRLERFLSERLNRYADERNDPDRDASSGLSPYLHFGNISPHEIFAALKDREGWTPEHINRKQRGRREGFWGMSPQAEAFLDELVTWRELGFNLCAWRDDYARYESLPEWARQTLEDHRDDPRPHLYTLEEFEHGQTHDRLWNAAQTELRTEGTIHNYLRMLWGKKILHWSRTPQEALQIMIELNDKYALDGRDPNSYSGIFWVLGRYDRAWGPEREVFGKVRYMTSKNTARKLRLDDYLARYAPSEG